MPRSPQHRFTDYHDDLAPHDDGHVRFMQGLGIGVPLGLALWAIVVALAIAAGGSIVLLISSALAALHVI
jgi:hypothetical protein